MLTNRTPEAHAWALEQFKTFRSAGQFVPLSVDRQTVIFPGFDGGGEWGGPAVDPRTGVLYINANDLAWTGGLTENKPGGSPGQVLYQTQCAICHGGDLKGNPPAFPSLVAIDRRLTSAQIASTIQGGKGRMPGFPSIQNNRLGQLIDYLAHPSETASTQAVDTGGKDPLGKILYAKNCALCHGDDRQGEVSNYPGLLGVRARLTDSQILSNIHNGKGRMPAIPNLTPADTSAILRFLGPPMDFSQSDKTELASSLNGTSQVPRYRFTGYRRFLDPDGYPAVAPPWGTLNAIDLNTGKFLWKIPLGNYPELNYPGVSDTGSENYGGPVLTASGILFLAATIYDQQIRAFDAANGTLLWHADLPFAGVATPCTYMVGGKQYVAIATSNARNPKARQGAAYVAFALP
jgi:mono/diheme cytochrome c family protein